MSIYANPPVHRAALSELASIEDTDLGTLPRWNLADLYAGSSDPQIDADLDWAAEQARSMAQAVKGKMAQMTPEKLAQTIVWYETIYEKLGKLGTFCLLALLHLHIESH